MKTIFRSLMMISSFLLMTGFSTPKEPLAANAMGATVIELPYFAEGLVCTGEFVVVQGTWQIVSHVHADGSGGFHVVDQWNIKATGFGSFGNEYRLNYTDNFVVNIGADGLPFTRTRPVTFNVIGKGSAPNLKTSGVIHITVNNNGVVTANIGGLTTTCK